MIEKPLRKHKLINSNIVTFLDIQKISVTEILYPKR